MYKEAEEAYEKVLEIDNINDSELDQELFKTRAQQLQVKTKLIKLFLEQALIIKINKSNMKRKWDFQKPNRKRF